MRCESAPTRSNSPSRRSRKAEEHRAKRLTSAAERLIRAIDKLVQADTARLTAEALLEVAVSVDSDEAMADAVGHEQLAHILDAEAYPLALSAGAGDPWPPLARARDLLPEAARVLEEATDALERSGAQTDDARRLRQRIEDATVHVKELQAAVTLVE